MKQFKKKVAVITGAASGIGKAIAERCCAEGMKVVIADIEENALKQAEKEMKANNASVLSVVTDVSKEGDIKMLAKKTIDTFGAVHLLFNNAGVGVGPYILRNTMKDYKWVFDVNLWGVIYGMYTFLPIMLEQNEECHIINTSSSAGIVPSDGPYGITKFGVTALSEMFAIELKANNSKVKVSAIYPGIVNTNIVKCQRNRPKWLENPKIDLSPEMLEKFTQTYTDIKQLYSSPDSMSPKTIADIVFHAIKNETLFIFTDLASEVGIKIRAEAMLNDMKVLKQFIKKTGRSREEFHSELLDQGYRSKY
ncbi:MAG: SDR family NAD(P)-dependent oxidoreductase [Promethearchaeota archaeon]